jgi:hypothetical protein
LVINKTKFIKTSWYIWLPYHNRSKTIVFKPGPVQDPGSGSWSGDRVGRVNLYFKKKSKQRRFDKKKSTGCNRVFDRVLPGHTRSWFFLFFINPIKFQPWIGWISKLWVKQDKWKYIKYFVIHPHIWNRKNSIKRQRFENLKSKSEYQMYVL